MTRPVTRPTTKPRTATKPATKKKRRGLKHGDTVYCVFVGKGTRKKKLSCHRSKERAKTVADREKLKRAKGTGVRISKTKFELKCKKGSKRVCRTRKKGSRACKKWGCAKK